MRLEYLRQFRKVVDGFYNKWINREGPILGGWAAADRSPNAKSSVVSLDDP